MSDKVVPSLSCTAAPIIRYGEGSRHVPRHQREMFSPRIVPLPLGMGNNAGGAPAAQVPAGADDNSPLNEAADPSDKTANTANTAQVNSDRPGSSRSSPTRDGRPEDAEKTGQSKACSQTEPHHKVMFLNATKPVEVADDNDSNGCESQVVSESRLKGLHGSQAMAMDISDQDLNDLDDDNDDEYDGIPNLIFDHLDMDKDKRVFPEEVGQFVDRFLWSMREPIREEMRLQVNRQAAQALDTINQGLPDSLKQECFHSEDMGVLAKAIFGSESVFSCLYRSTLFANTILLRQFLVLDYDKEVKSFSPSAFFYSWVWFQVLPITMMLPHRHLGKSQAVKSLISVRQLILQSMWRLFMRFGPAEDMPKSPYGRTTSVSQSDVSNLHSEKSMRSKSLRSKSMRFKGKRASNDVASDAHGAEDDEEVHKRVNCQVARAKWEKQIDKWLAIASTVVVCVVFFNVYFCFLAWWSIYGPEMKGTSVNTFQEVVTWLDPREDVGFFEAHMPFLILQVIIVLLSCKTAIRGGIRVQQYAATVHDLGVLTTKIKGRHKTLPPDGGSHWTIGAVLQQMQEETDQVAHKSKLKRTIRIITYILPLFLIGGDRATRYLLVGDVVPHNQPWGLLIAIQSLVSLIVITQLWYAEYCELMEFLAYQLIRARVYSRLFSRHQAELSGLPCMKNYWSENIVHWARIRAYVQKPNVIEMAWFELSLIVSLILVVVYSICFVFALIGGKLLEQRSDERTGDTQAGMLFLMLLFFWMALFAIYMILMAVKIGEVYNNDLKRLHREIFDCVCRMHNAGKQPTPACQCDEQLMVMDVLNDTGNGLVGEMTQRNGTRPSPSRRPAKLKSMRARARPSDPSSATLISTTPMASPKSLNSEIGKGGLRAPTAAAGFSTDSYGLESPYSRTQMSMNGLKAPSFMSRYIPSMALSVNNPDHKCEIDPDAPLLTDVQEYSEVLSALAVMVANSCEYITVVGIPVDAKFKTAIISVITTGALAVVSTLIGVIAKQYTDANV